MTTFLDDGAENAIAESISHIRDPWWVICSIRNNCFLWNRQSLHAIPVSCFKRVLFCKQGVVIVSSIHGTLLCNPEVLFIYQSFISQRHLQFPHSCVSSKNDMMLHIIIVINNKIYQDILHSSEITKTLIAFDTDRELRHVKISVSKCVVSADGNQSSWWNLTASKNTCAYLLHVVTRQSSPIFILVLLFNRN